MALTRSDLARIRKMIAAAIKKADQHTEVVGFAPEPEPPEVDPYWGEPLTEGRRKRRRSPALRLTK